MKKQSTPLHRFFRSGSALIVVMLIILGATAIGLVSLRITQTDNRMTTAFQYTRQAANASHQSAVYLHATSSDDINQRRAKQKKSGYETAMQSGGLEAWNAINSASDWKKPEDISAFSGMSNTLPTSESNSTRLKGDLAHPTIQAAAIGSDMLDNSPVAGFSNPSHCTFTEHGDAYALIGRAVPLREKGGTHYYLLADLNSHVSAYKREMGLIKLEAATCD